MDEVESSLEQRSRAVGERRLSRERPAHDCMDAGGRATHGAVAEEVRAGGNRSHGVIAMDGKENLTNRRIESTAFSKSRTQYV